jgi:hypothetical protein
MNGKSKEKLPRGEGASWIEGVVRDFLLHSPENTLRNQAKDRAFEPSFLGVDGPLFCLLHTAYCLLSLRSNSAASFNPT